MAEQATVETAENYKGLLIQYCQERGLSQPIYTETQSGPPDAPSWKVTVRYGDWIHETTESIPGSKKLAHQIASKQALDEIDSRRERFLSGEIPDEKIEPAPTVAATEVTEVEVLEIPTHIVSSALTIANERLTASQPTRYRTFTDEEFSRKLANMTLKIVRNLVKKAEKEKITFV